jgi:hypothetical protein
LINFLLYFLAMKKKLLLLTLLLCACQLAKAQTQDSTFYRHSLGITINPIYDADGFTAKHPTALGLMYRYQYKENKAIRLAASGAYDRRTYLTTHQEHPAPHDSLISAKFIELAIGYEWRSQHNELISLGMGIDVSSYILRKHEEVDNILIGDNTLIHQEYKQNFNTSGYGIQPFLNLQLKLTPRLFLAAECKASIMYSKTEYTAAGTQGSIDAPTEDRGILFGGDKREKLSASLKPISSLQLNFRL